MTRTKRRKTVGDIGFVPPLPSELEKDIEASVERFRAMFPALFRSAAEEFVPAYRAEITNLIHKAHRTGMTEAFNQAGIPLLHPTYPD
jgi:hypothetical protein